MAKPNPLKDMAGQVAASMKGHDIDRIAQEQASGTKIWQPGEPPGPPPKPEPETEAQPKNSRAGKRFLGFYVEPQRHEEIKQAALDEGLQVQELLVQALDDWMAANGQDAVAAVARRRAKRAGRSAN